MVYVIIIVIRKLVVTVLVIEGMISCGKIVK